MQDPRIQKLRTAYLERRKMIDDLLEARTKYIENPRRTLNDVSALDAELNEFLDQLWDEMHDIAETLEARGATAY